MSWEASQRTRLKYVANCNVTSLPEDTDPDFEFHYVDIGAVTQGTIAVPTERMTFGQAPSRARRTAQPGDSVVSTVRTYLRAVASVPEYDDPLVFSTGFAVVHPRSNIDARYLSWYLQGDEFVSRVVSASVGVSYPAITATEMMSLSVSNPPVRMQRAIADYLDRETAQIDTLIAKQERLVAGLKERRLAGITSRVTSGLDANKPRRSTDLGWTSAVPAHWEVVNIRRVAEMKTGHTPSRSVDSYWENTAIPWFTLADVWQLRDGKRTFLGETANQISRLGLDNSAAELLPAGTVVLSRTASVGFSGIMPIEMATSQDFWNWVCGPRLDPEFLLNVFRAMKDHFSSLMIGSTHKTIYQPVAAAIRIPLPPIDEQRAIVHQTGIETSKIDALIAKAEQFIALAKERRAALITAAVTGQIDITAA